MAAADSHLELAVEEVQGRVRPVEAAAGRRLGAGAQSPAEVEGPRLRAGALAVDRHDPQEWEARLAAGAARVEAGVPHRADLLVPGVAEAGAAAATGPKVALAGRGTVARVRNEWVCDVFLSNGVEHVRRSQQARSSG